MKKRTGFTLIEILIAISVLLIGILGVTSLFPVALQMGDEAITNSLAADMSRSVEEQLRASIKHRKFVFAPERRGHILHAFIYEHDGVLSGNDERDPHTTRAEKDPVVINPEDLARHSTYWRNNSVILFPCDNSARAAMGYSGESTPLRNRRKAYLLGKVFVYPEGDPDETTERGRAKPANGRGNPQNADDDKDDFRYDHTKDRVPLEMQKRLVEGEEWPLRVTKTYLFGTRLAERFSGGDSKFTIDTKSKEWKQNPYRSYSYAFAVRRAFEDGNLSPQGQKYIPANELFEVKVMIFKAFQPETINAQPVFTTTFLISR